MNHQELLQQMIGMALVLLLLVACGTPATTPTLIPPTPTSAEAPVATSTPVPTETPTQSPPTNTPTPAPPTPTPIPPTATPVPPVVYIGTPEADIEVSGVFVFPEMEQPDSSTEDWMLVLSRYVHAKIEQLDSGQPLPNIFPSGTTQLYIVVRGGFPPGTRIEWDIYTDAGPVALETGERGLEMYEATGEMIKVLPISPLNGVFTDGTYQAKIKINDVEIALLNWTVGAPGAS